MKIEFRTQFNAIASKHYYTSHGEKIEIRHSPHMDSNGRRFLMADKPVDVFNLIQSHKEECMIENIIRRAVEGDYNALNTMHGIYTDITNCPSSIAEAQQYIIDAKNRFNKLPKEIKAKFEYNAEMYIAELGNNPESWLEKMGYKDKMELQKKREETETLNKENFNKAMSNLAQGTIITNPAGEVESND